MLAKRGRAITTPEHADLLRESLEEAWFLDKIAEVFESIGSKLPDRFDIEISPWCDDDRMYLFAEDGEMVTIVLEV